MGLNLALRLGAVIASGAYDPLTAIPWHSAYWASDPGWSNPGNGNNVTTWDDGSGSGNNVTTGSGTPPVFRSSTAAFNSQSTVEFNVGTLGISLGASKISAPVTKVLIYNHTALTGAGQHVMSCYSAAAGRGSDFNWELSTASYVMYAGGSELKVGTPDTDAHCFFNFYNGASSTMKQDGTTIGSGVDVGSNQTDGWLLGGHNGTPQLKGHIAFAGVLARALTTGEETDLLAWSQSFYATP